MEKLVNLKIYVEFSFLQEKTILFNYP